MYQEQENVFYYLTVMNEFYPMPPMPEGVREGILRGMYRIKASAKESAGLRAQLFGSGSILCEVLRAQKMLEEMYGVAADVWSVTSYKELHRDGRDVERWNMLHPMEQPRIPYVSACLAGAPGVLVAASDYVRALPDSISRWFPRPLTSLGTDGFGRSDTRQALRNFFEVDARFITLATLTALAREQQVGRDLLRKAMIDLAIEPGKPDPMKS
jgi:pyruvate dehydrogenase E1 component